MCRARLPRGICPHRGGAAPARNCALTRRNPLAILAHSGNEVFVRQVTAEWEKVGREAHLDVDDLLRLSEPYWDTFFCDSQGSGIALSVIDKIRLQGKLITR